MIESIKRPTNIDAVKHQQEIIEQSHQARETLRVKKTEKINAAGDKKTFDIPQQETGEKHKDRKQDTAKLAPLNTNIVEIYKDAEEWRKQKSDSAINRLRAKQAYEKNKPKQ